VIRLYERDATQQKEEGANLLSIAVRQRCGEDVRQVGWVNTCHLEGRMWRRMGLGRGVRQVGKRLCNVVEGKEGKCNVMRGGGGVKGCSDGGSTGITNITVYTTPQHYDIVQDEAYLC
jgi:hypothetical protein